MNSQPSPKIDLAQYKNKSIVFDIDGVIAEEDLKVPPLKRRCVKDARKSIALLQQKGYKIVLMTSRFPSQKKETVEWLSQNGIPFDKIIFGKPRGALYIDDRGYRFRGWEEFFDDIEI